MARNGRRLLNECKVDFGSGIENAQPNSCFFLKFNP